MPLQVFTCDGLRASPLLCASDNASVAATAVRSVLPCGAARKYCGGQLTASSQLPGRMQRPVRVAQQLARQQNHIGLPGAQNVLGLVCIGDHAHRAGLDLRLTPDALSKRRLVTRSYRHHSVRNHSAR